MPFIRHARDKRGYETTYVMHAYRPAHGQGQGRTRVLYFFRSPSHIRVGRQPLDEETREALQHTHPDLSFDWFSLGRESLPARDERSSRRDRGRDSGPRPAARDRQPRTPEAPVVQLIDESVLGRAVGAPAAARLRERYLLLLQRITRRARTPEERDRLTEAAERLNPDEWADEASARAAAATVEREWEAIVASLPQRRRGRRGGRRSPEMPPLEDVPAGSPQPSDIIEGEGDVHAVPEDPPRSEDPGAGRRADHGGAEPLGGAADEPAGDGFPGDD